MRSRGGGAPSQVVESGQLLRERQSSKRRFSDLYVSRVFQKLMQTSDVRVWQANGTLRATAAVAEKLIEEALALDQWHPLAIHLLIHVSEESSPLRYDPA